ncbi:hypothetical protein EBB07_28315 [Paenibacillaceae bacterium]|nr:hypothetical protein EBB07_28315 [Paenibacillaceae bacterium]
MNKSNEMIDWIEKHFGYKLLQWQKQLVNAFVENEDRINYMIVYAGRRTGKVNFQIAFNEYLRMKKLKEEGR